MLALFDHTKYISWNFNLEEEIILTLQVQENELQIDNNGLDQKFHLKRLRKPILLEIPRKVYREKSRALAYREILNKIKSLTFVIYNGEAFEKFERQLLDIVESFDKSAPTDSGLILEPGKTVARNRYKYQIPSRVSKKSELTFRAGIAAEKQQLSRTIDVQPKTEETLKISEEVTPLHKVLFFDEHGRF